LRFLNDRPDTNAKSQFAIGSVLAALEVQERLAHRLGPMGPALQLHLLAPWGLRCLPDQVLLLVPPALVRQACQLHQLHPLGLSALLRQPVPLAPLHQPVPPALHLP
jgi:hypothetical protein